jgi:cyclophilin family peptidyl-prolyl cis-trans isomerase/HEAT repeat protein
MKRNLQRAELLLAIALFAAGGCAARTVTPPAAAPVVVPAEPVELGAAHVATLAELLRMEDLRALDTVLVERGISSAHPEVRGRAALAAGRLRNRAAVPFLLRALADGNPTVRTRAAFALGELADSTPANAAAIAGALGHIALHDVAAPATEAAASLGRIGTAHSRVFIDSLLTVPRLDAQVRNEALLAAWRLPRDTGTIARIARWISSPDAETRWRAAYALGRNGAAAGLPAAMRIVNDPDPRVRSNAVRLLRGPVADTAGIRDAAFAAALAAVRDSHPHVRINAIATLASFRDNARTTPALIERLLDSDGNVAFAAATALAGVRDPASASALRSAVTNAALADGVRTAALTGLLAVDPPAAASIALQWTDSTRWILRFHALRALGPMPWAEKARALERLARDENVMVATAALGRIVADSAADARRVFIDRLASANPYIRAAAARGLGGRSGAADIDILLQAYQAARRDSVRDAAVAIVDALGRIGRTGVPVDRSFYLRFGQFGPPADVTLYRAIINRIGTPPANWPVPTAPAVTPRPMEFYTDIVRRYVVNVLNGQRPPRAVITTIHGDIELELAAADAPLTVHNFLSLIESGYYVNARWHRVVPNFVIQDGERGDGSGGPGYSIRDEINPLRYDRGALGMALSGPDTGSSQWFITHSPQPHLDGGYTVFGRVINGMDAVDRVVQEEPILSIRAIR